MPLRSLHIALVSTLAVLGFAAGLVAQYKLETEPSDKADPTSVAKPVTSPTESPANQKPKPDLRPISDLDRDTDPLRLDPSVPTANPPLSYRPGQRQIPHVIPRTVYETVMRALTKEEEQELANYGQLFQSLREAKDDATRQSIAENIKKLLGAKFDRDMAEREKEIKAVEERVAALRKQQEKRASMKDEIISVRLKAILFKAEGLDFPLNFPTAPVTGPTSGLPSDLYDGSVSPTRIAPTRIAPTYIPPSDESQPQSIPIRRPDDFTAPSKK